MEWEAFCCQWWVSCKIEWKLCEKRHFTTHLLCDEFPRFYFLSSSPEVKLSIWNDTVQHWEHFTVQFKTKQGRILRQSIVLLHDTRTHSAQEFGCEQFDHTTYSPNLTFSAYHLFLNSNHYFGGRCFDSVDAKMVFNTGCLHWQNLLS